MNLSFSRHSLSRKLSSGRIALSHTIHIFCIWQCHVAYEMWLFLTPIYGMQYLTTLCNVSSPPVQSLLSDPNPASPANAEASQLYERDRGYVRRLQVMICLTNTLRWAEYCPCLCAYLYFAVTKWLSHLYDYAAIMYLLLIIHRMILLMMQSLTVNGNCT